MNRQEPPVEDWIHAHGAVVVGALVALFVIYLAISAIA